MRSFPILKNKIKESFSEPIYRQGQAYFNNGHIRHLYYEKNQNKWQGKIVGSDEYAVSIQINEHDMSYECECLASSEYGECKHIVACLLEIERRQGNRSYMPDENIQKKVQQKMVNQFINTFSNFYQSEGYNQEHINKHQLQVEFIVKTMSRSASLWTLELKIGIKRTYVVKDLKQFLKAVEQQKNYYFTDNYTYEPMEQVFKDEDFELIHLLIDVSRNEEAYIDPYFSYRKEDRVVYVPPMVVDAFLSKLLQTTYTFENGDQLYNQIELIDEDLPFNFKLDKGEEEEFRLNVTEMIDMSFFELYNYVLKDNCLYKLTTEQQNILLEISSGLLPTDPFLDDEQYITISADQIESFLSVVVPEMKKVGQIEMAEQVSNQIIQHPLKTKLLIDREEDTLLVDLEYHYGEKIINPFNEFGPDNDETKELMIRDTRKEQQIMSVIESALLKFNGKKLYVEGEEEIYNFLYRSVPFLEDKADIFLTNAVKDLLLPESQAPETTFDFNKEGSLLEVSFDMKDIGQEHIQNILDSVIEKKNYYRLPNGTFVSIEGNEQFQHIRQLYSELNSSETEIRSGSIQLPLYRAMQVDDILNGGNKNKVRIGKQFRHLIQTLKNPDELDFELPTDLQAELRDYQEIGFQWLKTLAHYSLGGILADDMGLGKTVQGIAFLLSEKEESKETKPALIVAPASLVYNWKMEFDKFAPSLDVEVVIGTPIERAAILERKVVPDVFITSYPMLRHDLDWYKDVQFSSFFLDEAQAVKNAATKTSKAVRTIRAHKRFALSGTPIENSLDELWAIFEAILPGFFPSHALFRKLSPEKISRMSRPFILRRLKKDVLTELPDKIESTHVSELTTEQKELYLAYLERIQRETKQSLMGEGLNKSRIKILAGLTRLRQLCCHPSLFIENYQGSSGKLEQLIDIVGNALENKKRMLIFSQFTSMLHIIREELTRQGVGFFYIDGHTPSKERVELVERFNQGENDIFLISLKAGGTGLNLTGADTVILYDLWWNPAVEDQAAGRAHRMGQKNVVQVIRLITKGTIEEKIEKLQQRKKELIERVIQPGDAMLSSMSEDDIRELLSI
ncbi:DEAD/DEAH box helicase [Paraliobacillus sediminis]|uniref:DEAD/DEAH box helicase n=1 Tax=Paraliobacillus sediminis TaxID=1885916 RepID=UPI000E3D5B87|nr:DEAD/DEAH box helicase [Paraliobacillus sediminis]